MVRPVLYVLAGVNGAGKSSIGGHMLTREGLSWFNPDTFARELIEATGCDQESANGHAWAEGVRRLDDAVAAKQSYAFETTLGGRTVAAKILAAARTQPLPKPLGVAGSEELLWRMTLLFRIEGPQQGGRGTGHCSVVHRAPSYVSLSPTYSFFASGSCGNPLDAAGASSPAWL